MLINNLHNKVTVLALFIIASRIDKLLGTYLGFDT